MKKFALALCLALLTSAAISQAKVPVKNPAVSVKSETVTGTITMCSAKEHLVFVKSEGASYSFQIVPATKILCGAKISNFEELAKQIGQEVEITFRPLHIGNQAITVEVK